MCVHDIGSCDATASYCGRHETAVSKTEAIHAATRDGNLGDTNVGGADVNDARSRSIGAGKLLLGDAAASRTDAHDATLSSGTTSGIRASVTGAREHFLGDGSVENACAGCTSELDVVLSDLGSIDAGVNYMCAREYRLSDVDVFDTVSGDSGAGIKGGTRL